MSNANGPAALRMLAGDFELTKAACWNESDTASMWTLAAAWEAERQACQSAIEEADRLRFASEAQAAADRAALAQARALLANMVRVAEWYRGEGADSPMSAINHFTRIADEAAALSGGAR